MKSPSGAAELIALQAVVSGRYSVERELGRGGMGIVFLCRDVALDRAVAIKLLPPVLAATPQLRERFLREARTAARLSHPNVVPIHAVEEHGDLVFFVMGFVEGESLAERVARTGPLDPAAGVRLVQEAAWALAYAHRQGIVHRDVKPDNIMLEGLSGRAMLTDFGIAKAVDGTSVTSAGEIVGTARYMSPEQAAGEPVDGRSDLYSLGVTAFFALTGRAPFDMSSAPALIVAHLQEAPPPVASLRPDLPQRLAAVVDRCLSKAAADRFASGEELADAVAEARTTGLQVPDAIRRLQRETEAWLVDSAGLLLLWVLIYLLDSLVRARKGDGVDMFTGMFDSNFRFSVLLILSIVWIVRTSSVVAHARTVLRGGFRISEVITAPRISPAGGGASGTGRWTRVARWFLAVAAIALLAWGWLFRQRLDYLPTATSFLIDVLLIAGPLVLGRLIVMTPLRESRRLDGFLRRGLMGSALRLASIGLRPRGLRGARGTDRTELLLHHAAAGLFEELPREVRERFPDLPALVARLDSAALLLRTREEQLASAVAQAGPAAGGSGLVAATIANRHGALVSDIESARQRIRERLATTIAALENIRIGLLRLRSGLGKPEDLTPDLEAARRIGERIDALVAANMELDSILLTSRVEGVAS